MRTLWFLTVFLYTTTCFAQKHTPLPHGMVYGDKPDTLAMRDASKLEAFMDKQIRTSTTIKGKVVKVTKPKGGWFDIDAGGGKVIAAHFKNAGINLPTDLAGANSNY